LSIAFLTLFERHVLGMRQDRKGPCKVSYFGTLQALFDGFKLFKKELIGPLGSYKEFFVLLPFFLFFIIFLD
jgi:NADH:ubiquinone oxidoreductase subunit H